MGDKYLCSDCKEYFRIYKCRSCKHMVKDRCYWCHFDYMNDLYLEYGHVKQNNDGNWYEELKIRKHSEDALKSVN